MSRTFRNYVKHIPGNLAIEKKATAETSLLAKVNTVDLSEFVFRPISFQPFSEEELKESFSLLEGGVPQEHRVRVKAKLTKEQRELKRKKRQENEARKKQRQ